MAKRPTFYYDNKPVRAGGILFYVNDNGNRMYLLRKGNNCLLYTSPSPRDRTRSRMPSSA